MIVIITTMATDRTTFIMNGVSKAMRGNYDCIKFAQTDNINELILLFHNVQADPNCYEGGEYLAMFKLPPEFPSKPPSFHLLTPNGIYKPGVNICISGGSYHADQYTSNIGIGGFAMQIVSGLITPDVFDSRKGGSAGIGITIEDPETRQRLAQKSREFNYKNHPDLMEQINTQYDAYSKIVADAPVVVDEVDPRAARRAAARAAKEAEAAAAAAVIEKLQI